MATATVSITTETVMKPVKTEVKTVTLVLSEDEAAMLSALLYCGVSGPGVMPLIGYDEKKGLLNQLQHTLGGTHRVSVDGVVRVLDEEPTFTKGEFFRNY